MKIKEDIQLEIIFMYQFSHGYPKLLLIILIYLQTLKLQMFLCKNEKIIIKNSRKNIRFSINFFIFE